MNYPPARESNPGPSALTVLVALCIVVHGLRWFAPPPLPNTEIPGALGLEALQRGEWWACLTHIFTHLNLVHLGGNVALLLLAGRPLQRMAGQQHTVYIFLLSAWAGAALSMMLRPQASIIGASGAAMGLAGACSALFPEANLLKPLRHRVHFQLRAKQLFPALLTSFVILELLARKGLGPTHEAHLVHAGGILAGWLYGRRLAAPQADESHDFFPLGPRRRSIEHEEHDHALLFASLAKLPARRDTATQPVPGPSAPPAATLSDSEFLSQRVDPVLEKLYTEGADKLSPEEKAILEEAARRFPRSNNGTK